MPVKYLGRTTISQVVKRKHTKTLQCFKCLLLVQHTKGNTRMSAVYQNRIETSERLADDNMSSNKH